MTTMFLKGQIKVLLEKKIHIKSDSWDEQIIPITMLKF